MTTAQINEMLNQMKIDLDLKTDAQLARHLKVQPITVWRWRQGELDETKQLLISYFLHRAPTAELAAV